MLVPQGTQFGNRIAQCANFLEAVSEKCHSVKENQPIIWQVCCVLSFVSCYFYIISNLQKNCKTHVRSCHVPVTQILQLFMFCLILSLFLYIAHVSNKCILFFMNHLISRRHLTKWCIFSHRNTIGIHKSKLGNFMTQYYCLTVYSDTWSADPLMSFIVVFPPDQGSSPRSHLARTVMFLLPSLNTA